MMGVAVLTPQAMVAAEKKAAEQYGIPSELLMEAAGLAVATAAREMLSPGCTVGLLVGPGQNGGDALVAGRHLISWGYPVKAFVAEGANPPRGAAASNLDRLKSFPGVSFPHGPDDSPGNVSLVVDGLFGTGLRTAPRGAGAALLRAALEWDRPRLAVDIPSGIDAATGEIPGMALRADVTVTFGAPKPGHLMAPGRFLCGRLQVAPIGLPPLLVDSPVRWVAGTDGLLPPWDPEDHKRSRGRVLLIAGSDGMAGAAGLSALGALRSAAGLVHLAVPKALEPRYAALCPEALTIPLAPGDGEACEQVRLAAERADAVGVGPGLGRLPRTRALVATALQASGGPVVLDADALWAVGETRKLLLDASGPLVMTPHEGEFRRLFPTLEGSPLDRAQKAARESGAICLLKGPSTVVASPSGEAAILTEATDLLAQGGSGDVLTGVLVALLARMKGPFEASVAAAAIHGRASALLLESRGRGAGARALAEMLPVAMGRESS